jgi:hypothetical protein
LDIQNEEKDMKKLNESIIGEIDISERTVLLTGLPKDFPKKKLKVIIKSMFEEILEKEGVKLNQLLSVYVVSDLNKCN